MSELQPAPDFLLYDWLHAESLVERPRFADHSRATFDSVLDTSERIARERFAPFNRLVDTEEPHLDGERVLLPAATRQAVAAYAGSGRLAAGHDGELGGMQLPYVIDMADRVRRRECAIANRWKDGRWRRNASQTGLRSTRGRRQLP